MTTRTAVIGAGRMGRNHARVYNEMPGVTLAAIVDASPHVREEMSNLYNVPVFDNLDEMLDKVNPDAVSVVVPTKVHYEVVTRLLNAGCNVLVEKPIASDLDDAVRMIRLAERMNRVLMVGHIERFNPAVIELKRRLDAGELGRVFQVHARRIGPFPTRIQDVGVVMDLATHDLDIMRYLTSSEVYRVFAESTQEVHASFEDLFVGTLRFMNDTIGMLEINWLTPTKIRELYVTGERGMMLVNYITQDLCFYENSETNRSDWSTLSLIRGVTEGSVTRHAVTKREPLRVELEAFVDRVNGVDCQITTGVDAVAALALSLALSESAWTGRVVNMERSVQNTVLEKEFREIFPPRSRLRLQPIETGF